jgi:hypothetical protein
MAAASAHRDRPVGGVRSVRALRGAVPRLVALGAGALTLHLLLVAGERLAAGDALAASLEHGEPSTVAEGYIVAIS